MFTVTQLTQKEIKAYLKEKLSKDMYKRLRPLIVSNYAYQPKKGNYIGIHIPAFININVDYKFEIYVNEITTVIRNSKVCVTVWNDTRVASQITVYS